MPRLFATAALAITVGFAPVAENTSLLAKTAGDPTLQSRTALIARSKVWRRTDIRSVNFKVGPPGPGAFAPKETVTCTFINKELAGASPKFACRRPNGDELKVKYGGDNGEVYGEVAASRLLWALGFGADRMYSVRVICRGCPRYVGGILRSNGDRIVDPAAVERKVGRELADAWKWSELELTDKAAGGASTAERDALKLLAALLQHSDSKPKNQRIVCLDRSEAKHERCSQPLMMISDVGLTFGRAAALNQQSRASVNLDEWARLPVWKDSDQCVANLSGSWTGTLKDPVISEAGRRFLARLLTQLSDQQLHDLFEAARVNLRTRRAGDPRSGLATIDEWVYAFKTKRAQIVNRTCAA